jgi:hypothetical protein
VPSSQALWSHREAKQEAIPSPKTAPNIALEPTPYSARSAPAFGRGSPRALCGKIRLIHNTGASAAHRRHYL